MDTKTLTTLEFPKILERLAGYCAFAASADKARLLLPSADIEEALRRQAETREALTLLHTHPDLTIGGARDVREIIDLAGHGGVLAPTELLDIKFTLIAARNLARLFERVGGTYTNLYAIAARMPPPTGLIDAIQPRHLRARGNPGQRLREAGVDPQGAARRPRSPAGEDAAHGQ